VKLLLDTHIVLWVLRDARELKAGARSMIGHAEVVFVSAASWWEVSIKAAAGKLRIEPERLQAQALAAGFEPLPITWTHALAVHGLPPLHRDPFDRMLIAQAISEPLHLLTHDPALAAYSDLVTVV
jgi:PIN domain nuclease of toxin-antitoxin system